MIELRFPGQCLIEMILSGNSSFERTSLKEQVLKEQVLKEQVLLRSTKYKVERRTFRAESRKYKNLKVHSA
jgi:hypothetical protein